MVAEWTGTGDVPDVERDKIELNQPEALAGSLLEEDCARSGWEGKIDGSATSGASCRLGDVKVEEFSDRVLVQPGMEKKDRLASGFSFSFLASKGEGWLSGTSANPALAGVGVAIGSSICRDGDGTFRLEGTSGEGCNEGERADWALSGLPRVGDRIAEKERNELLGDALSDEAAASVREDLRAPGPAGMERNEEEGDGPVGEGVRRGGPPRPSEDGDSNRAAAAATRPADGIALGVASSNVGRGASGELLRIRGEGTEGESSSTSETSSNPPSMGELGSSSSSAAAISTGDDMLPDCSSWVGERSWVSKSGGAGGNLTDRADTPRFRFHLYPALPRSRRPARAGFLVSSCPALHTSRHLKPDTKWTLDPIAARVPLWLTTQWL